MLRFRQYIKMLLQNVCLPILYLWWARRPVQKDKILMADAHHTEMPFSMRRMYETLQEEGKTPELFVADFGTLGFGAMFGFLVRFMRAYATAEYVFLCDYFLPAASCRKRPETTLVQLWHSCGLMKKIAFDTGEDIPKHYLGNMFGNYSYLTVSAQICVSVHAHALRIPQERVVATGISRTDYYFDPAWNARCRGQFYAQHPEAKGKKIAVWAPTFRGNAAQPYLVGLSDVRAAASALGEGWMLLIRAHPHIDAHRQVSNCTIPAEELFAVADVLITDYSSVMFDYLIYKKPLVLFAPDLAAYEAKRGFYLDYRGMPFEIAWDGAALARAVEGSAAYTKAHEAEQAAFCRTYTGACDGKATERILKRIGLD